MKRTFFGFLIFIFIFAHFSFGCFALPALPALPTKINSAGLVDGSGRYIIRYSVGSDNGSRFNHSSTSDRRSAIFVRDSSNYSGVECLLYSSLTAVSLTSNIRWVTNNNNVSTRPYSIGYTSAYSYGQRFLVDTNLPVFTNFDKLNEYLSTGVLNVDDTVNGGEEVDSSMLGYLSDVKYFVDSAAYLNDVESTPEYVKWGSMSTTGIDLSDSRYQVQFMCEDKSTYMRNNASDSWLDESGIPYARAATFVKSRLDYALGYLFPSGSDQRALLQGRAAKTSLYGSASSLGTVAASAGQFKFSAAKQYKTALANNSDSDKGLIYNLIDDLSAQNLLPAEKLFNNYQKSGKSINWTYDLYARIVDTSSGTMGNWLKIDRHNSPWELSADDRFLNGGVTMQHGYNFGDVNITNNTFNVLPDPTRVPDIDPDTGDPIPDTPKNEPIGTGYVVEGDTTQIFNNTNYFYYTTNNYNDYNTWNNYFQNPPTNSEDDHNNIVRAIDSIKALGVLASLFALLFSPILPAWATAFVLVAVGMIVAVAVWKIIKGVLPW